MQECGPFPKGMRIPAVLLLLALATGAEDPNLLPNGSFESGQDGWIFFQLGQNDAREVEKETLHVTKTAKTPDRPTMIWSDYALRAGDLGKLVFSIRAKGRKLGRAQILFILWDDSGNPSTQETALDGKVGTKWQTFTKTIDVDAPTKGGRILIRLFDDGELWLDDASVTLARAAEAPEQKGPLGLRNGDFDRSKDGWDPLPGSEELKVSLDQKKLRLERGGNRLYPELGVAQEVELKGRLRRVTLRCTARGEGATACVALVADTGSGALATYAYAEASGDVKLPLDLGVEVKRLRVVLAIRGPGTVWFDDVRLE
jgi:hypothetical protein